MPLYSTTVHKNELWNLSDWRYLKNKLVIGLGDLCVLAQRQGLMTSGSHLDLPFLLLQQIESRRQTGRHSGSRQGMTPPPRPGKEGCDIGVGEIIVCNPKKTTLDNAKKIKALEYI